MDKLLEIAGQYGPLGFMVLACFFYILKREKDYKEELKQHREERKELADAIEKQHEEALTVTKNNTTVLTEISTLIRDRAKR